MAKKCYVGISSKAKRVKKIYVGINGVCKKIKKAYIGVNGVARLFYSPTYTITKMSNATSLTAVAHAATHVGNYALYAVGSYSSTVNAYDTSLTRSSPTGLSIARTSVGYTHIGNYALFAGGKKSTTVTDNTNRVDAYNTSLTRSQPTALSFSQSSCAGSTNGAYAIFGYGVTNLSTETYSKVNKIDCYNSSLTKTSITQTPFHNNAKGTHVGNYALFVGGQGLNSRTNTVGWTNRVEVINQSLTQSYKTLSSARMAVGVSHVGDYAILVAGRDLSETTYNKYGNTVECFNSSLTQNSLANWWTRSSGVAGTHTNNFALFGGGSYSKDNSDYTYHTNVYSFDASLTKTQLTSVTGKKVAAMANCVGNFALFSTATTTSGSVLNIEVYKEVES